MPKLTTITTDHGTIVQVIKSRFGGYYWQAHRDFFGDGRTTVTSKIASGTEETLEAALDAGAEIEVGWRPPMAEPLVTFG